jgi:RNA polymerase sigma-70 factor (sigma-E family)
MSETDPEEFEAFFRAVWARLFRIVSFAAGDAQVAEDALQVATTRACRRWSRVKRMDSPEAYIRKIAMNEVLATRRRAASRSRVADPVLLPGGDSLVHGLEERDALWSAVLSLPPRQRAVVVLRYYEGLSESEIAETLDCRPGTVKSQASAAMTRLRQVVSETAEGGMA